MKKIYYPIILSILLLISCKVLKNNFKDIKQNKVEDAVLAKGELHRIVNFPSKLIDPRNVDVWLPEDYSTSKKYAVLYMHDGQNLFDPTKNRHKQEWKIDEVVSKLTAEGKIKNTIVVGIWNIPKLRYTDYYPQKPFDLLTQKSRDSLLLGFKLQTKYTYKEKMNSDQYLKFLVTELKPYIDYKYSTKTDVNNTSIAGSSMGGLISMYAICEYPEVFGAAACFSTHWIGTFSNKNNPIPATFLKYMDENLPNAKTHKMYFDYGTKTLDYYYLPYQDKVTAMLKKHDYHFNLKYEDGDHSENSWNKRLDIPLIEMLKPE